MPVSTLVVAGSAIYIGGVLLGGGTHVGCEAPAPVGASHIFSVNSPATTELSCAEMRSSPRTRIWPVTCLPGPVARRSAAPEFIWPAIRSATGSDPKTNCSTSLLSRTMIR